MVDILQSMPYSAPTFSIRTTDVFDTWFAGLQDRVAKRRIQARIDRLSMGNPGDWKSAGSPVVEMRIDHGPGYRVYYVRRGTIWVILLAINRRNRPTSAPRTRCSRISTWSNRWTRSAPGRGIRPII